jgi:DNA polymerase-1
MPIQGTAADIMKLAMIVVHDFLRRECSSHCTLLLQVHDELLFEIDDDAVPGLAPKIVHQMETAFPLDVRLKVDSKSGPTWADMKPISRISAAR